MKSIIQEIFLRLLYLTPTGYLLSLLTLQTGKQTPGVYITLQRYTPILAYIKPNPLILDRVQWLFNGISLILQALVVFSQKFGNIFSVYGWIALLYGIVNFISAVFPKFDWNKKLGVLRVTIIEILMLVLLGASVVLS